MKTNLIKVLFAVSLMVLASCNRDDDKLKPELEVESINNESQAQAEFDDLLSVTEDAMEEKGGQMRTENTLGCGTVSINTNTKVITIDFGTTGTLCTDGRTRKGIITISYTGKYRDSATVITTTLSNYEVKPLGSSDFVKVEGTKTITNKGRITNGKITFEVIVQNGKLTWPNNSAITFQSTRTRVWDKGSETSWANSSSVQIALADDEFLINGNTNGVSRGGRNFSTTLSNIRIKLGCWVGAPVGQRFRYPVSGTKTITTDGGTRTIDFGNGNCDASVTYTGVNGNSLNLVLPTW